MGLLKTIATKGFPQTVLTGPRKRFVFLYHDISDQDSPQYSSLYSTPVQRFKSQMELIAKHFKLVSLDEITSASDHKQPLASITFDDGFSSVKDEAFPYLNARGIPCAVFVNTMAIKDNRLFYGSEEPSINRTYDAKTFLDEADVRELAAKGVVIGNHSATHKDLATCDAETLSEEVLDSKMNIEGLIGMKVKHFALPFGKREHYNQQVLDFCYSAGHDYAYSTNPSYFDLADQKRDRRLIPRVSLLDESSEELYFVINRPLLKKIDI